MRKMIPDFAEEHQYRHPGPIHAKYGRSVDEPGDYSSMNTDGHLRSCFFGRSETMTIKDGVLDGEKFALRLFHRLGSRYRTPQTG